MLHLVTIVFNHNLVAVICNMGMWVHGVAISRSKILQVTLGIIPFPWPSSTLVCSCALPEEGHIGSKYGTYDDRP